MRRRDLRWILLVAAMAFVAVVPVYPAETIDYSAWFGPPGQNSRYDNGTTFHPLTEIAAGAFDWNVTKGACVTDSGGWTRFRAHPVVLLLYPLGVAGLWLVLRFEILSAKTARGRSLVIGVTGGGLAAASLPWLLWNGILALTCPPSMSILTAIAAILELFCLGAGIVLAVTRNVLAEWAWKS